MAIQTIEEISNYIESIRDSINQLLLDSGKETLSVNDTLEKYADTLSKIKVSNTKITQKMYALYVWAEGDKFASNKSTPIITWNKGDDSPTIDESNSEWKTIVPNPVDKSLLFVRFVTIEQDGVADYGTPLRLTGPAGPKGEDGLDGKDSIISTEIFRIVTLYHISNTLPSVPNFYVDTSDRFDGQLNVNRLYYKNDDNDVYIDTDNSKWNTTVDPNSSGKVWSIEVEIGSKGTCTLLTKEAISRTITVSSTMTKYLANSGTKPSEEDDGWNEERPALTEDTPRLWRKTTTTYSDNSTYSDIALIQELPTVIKNQEVLYATTDSITKEPDDSTWGDDYINGPVIWKKEITTYTNDIGGDNDENTVVTISPIAIQGEPGIKYVGSYNSENELEDINLNYGDEFIGRIGVVVAGNTYVWYGSNDPILGENCKEIGSYFWLKLGTLTYSDWNAKEDEFGYVKNRTHYKTTEHQRIEYTADMDNNNYVEFDLKGTPVNIKLWSGNGPTNFESSVIKSEYRDDDGTLFFSFDSSTNILQYYDPESDAIIEYDTVILKKLNPEFVPQMIETTYNELKSWRDNGQLIPGMQYRITDFFIDEDDYFDIVVTADTANVLNEVARAINTSNVKHGCESWKIWYCIDNDSDRFDWAGKVYIGIGGAESDNDEIVGWHIFDEFIENEEGWYNLSGTSYYLKSLNELSQTVYSLEMGEYWPDSGYYAKISTGIIYRMIDHLGNDCPGYYTTIMKEGNTGNTVLPTFKEGIQKHMDLTLHNANGIVVGPKVEGEYDCRTIKEIYVSGSHVIKKFLDTSYTISNEDYIIDVTNYDNILINTHVSVTEIKLEIKGPFFKTIPIYNLSDTSVQIYNSNLDSIGTIDAKSYAILIYDGDSYILNKNTQLS